MAIDIQGLCPLVQVFDMPTSLRFYRDLLGFELVQRSQDSDECGWAWLRKNGAELMLNTAYDEGERPAVPDAPRTRAHDDTCLYIGCPDLDAAYAYLVARGIVLDPPKKAWYGMKQLYLHDPDGYNICFQWKA